MYEYLVLPKPVGTDIEPELDAQGEEGWELVTVNNGILYFKRITEESKMREARIARGDFSPVEYRDEDGNLLT